LYCIVFFRKNNLHTHNTNSIKSIHENIYFDLRLNFFSVYIGRSSITSNTAKSFDILAAWAP